MVRQRETNMPFVSFWLGSTRLISPHIPYTCARLCLCRYRPGTALVVQWNRLRLRDDISGGTFTFQALLHSDGHIVFTYKEVLLLFCFSFTDANVARRWWVLRLDPCAHHCHQHRGPSRQSGLSRCVRGAS